LKIVIFSKEAIKTLNEEKINVEQLSLNQSLSTQAALFTVETRKNKISANLKARISEISRNGLVSVLFSHDIEKLANYSIINETVLEIKVSSSNGKY
jgi:hypothetical protein